MARKNFSVPMDGNGGYVNKSIWDQEPNKITYYDRKLDSQGTVPGPTLEEAEAAFEEEYGVSLSQ